MINEWVKKATDNLIDTVISTSDVDATTDLVLANAVYFKGAWLKPFNPYSARRSFHLLDGGVAEAEFMSKGSLTFMDVACLDGFKVLKLPYKPGADPWTWYSMFVFLPDARDGLSTMVDVVTASPAYLYGILAEMKEKPVIIQLPSSRSPSAGLTSSATSAGWVSRCCSRGRPPTCAACARGTTSPAVNGGRRSCPRSRTRRWSR
ncbi:hypothetical protein PVAP13_8NG112001 [Panicum virgatum]|uniref:Serpin domain-containing protein n=1 Tax=Panicum virgatum TaxID=38727 RepID=A0A8T0P887_PANVG|nr:hypothetical protein PVAP13_8NG112001 [Panicum virgatum]